MSQQTPMEDPTTPCVHIRYIRQLLLEGKNQPTGKKFLYESVFDAVVEGRFHGLFIEFGRSKPDETVTIIASMAASRPREFEALVKGLQDFAKPISDGEVKECFVASCIVGLIKGVTIINENQPSQHVDNIHEFNRIFVAFIVESLKIIPPRQTDYGLAAELSNVMAAFVGEAQNHHIDNGWRQLSLLCKELSAGYLKVNNAFLKGFLRRFVEEVTFKVWARLTPKLRLKALSESLMEAGVV